MLLLLDADRADHRKLRAKAMEHAGLICSFLLCSYDDLCTYLHA